MCFVDVMVKWEKEGGGDSTFLISHSWEEGGV